MSIYNDNYLTTLGEWLAQTKANALENASDDVLVTHFIVAASDIAQQYCRRSFVPYVQTRTFDAREPVIDGDLLRLDEDLLEVTTLTNGDDTVIGSSNYVLRGANATPRWGIKLKNSSGYYWTYSGSDYEDAISVAGVWGFHEDYANAWVDSGDTVQDAGGINASVQTVTVSDADGKDARYRTRFEVGKLLKIDSEFMKVVAVDASANALTVMRGANGSTAATHDNGATISTWAVQRNIEQAVIALVRWLYRHKQTDGDRIQFMNGTQIIMNEAPVHVQLTLNQYRRLRV